MTPPRKLAIISFEGQRLDSLSGEPIRMFDISPTAPDARLRWTADGRALTYIDTRASVSNIWLQPIDGSPPKQLTDFKSDLIFGFDWSRDGKQLVCSRGVVNRDVVMISNFR